LNIRITLANQLKSGDLSIETTNIKEVKALKQFADYAIILKHCYIIVIDMSIPSPNQARETLLTNPMRLNLFLDRVGCKAYPRPG